LFKTGCITPLYSGATMINAFSAKIDSANFFAASGRPFLSSSTVLYNGRVKSTRFITVVSTPLASANS